ncbi:uncharacterized [Tachysurus ichikawai]
MAGTQPFPSFLSRELVPVLITCGILALGASAQFSMSKAALLQSPSLITNSDAASPEAWEIYQQLRIIC